MDQRAQAALKKSPRSVKTCLCKWYRDAEFFSRPLGTELVYLTQEVDIPIIGMKSSDSSRQEVLQLVSFRYSIRCQRVITSIPYFFLVGIKRPECQVPSRT